MRCSLNCLFCGWVMSHLTRNGSVKGLKLNRFSFRESPAGRIIGWPVLRIVFGSRKLQSNETQEHTVGIQSNSTLRTPAALYGHHVITESFLCPWGKKALKLSLNSTRLIRTSITADNGHLFLTQIKTDSHRKSTSLIRAFHYQLCAVINLSFFKVKNLQLTACRHSQRYTGADRHRFPRFYGNRSDFS